MDSLIHSLKLYETYNLEFILFNAFIACPLWIKNLLESIIEMDIRCFYFLYFDE